MKKKLLKEYRRTLNVNKLDQGIDEENKINIGYLGIGQNRESLNLNNASPVFI